MWTKRKRELLIIEPNYVMISLLITFYFGFTKFWNCRCIAKCLVVETWIINCGDLDRVTPPTLQLGMSNRYGGVPKMDKKSICRVMTESRMQRKETSGPPDWGAAGWGQEGLKSSISSVCQHSFIQAWSLVGKLTVVILSFLLIFFFFFSNFAIPLITKNLCF